MLPDLQGQGVHPGHLTAPAAWALVREGLPTRLALGKAYATATGLSGGMDGAERAWLEAWTRVREAWTAVDLRGACRWLEAGGYLCGRGKVSPAQIAKHLEDWLTRAHADEWDPKEGRAPRHVLVAKTPPEGVATNLDEIGRRIAARKGKK